jgi:hypothetical protein
LDTKGERHLLIVLHTDEKELFDSQSRGLDVITRMLMTKGHPAARFLDIECQDPAGYPAFDIIGGEIAEELTRSEKEPAEIVKSVLSKWRRFWGQLPREVLSREQQLGLFAELWFLSGWLLPQMGSEALLAWRGPFGSRHDFEWADKSVEVKATSNIRGRILRINGLDQLDSINNNPLYLFSLRVREEMGSRNTLPGIIEVCRLQLVSDSDALGRLESLLMQAGYSPIHASEYLNLCIHVIEETLFIVKDDFPRMNNGSFSNGIPKAIEHVEYDINLNTYDHLIVARNPNEWQSANLLVNKKE